MVCECFECVFFSFVTLDNGEEEVAVAGSIGEGLDYLIFLKTRDKPGHRQAILKACNYFQSCIFYILKDFQNKNARIQ